MSNTAVPVFVTADPKNNIVPVRIATPGVPIAVFADPSLSLNNCVPVRLAVGDEIAVPVVLVSGNFADNLLLENGDDLLLEDGGILEIE